MSIKLYIHNICFDNIIFIKLKFLYLNNLFIHFIYINKLCKYSNFYTLTEEVSLLGSRGFSAVSKKLNLAVVSSLFNLMKVFVKTQSVCETTL